MNFIFLEGPDQEELAGYLVLPFPVDSSFFDDRFEMRLLVRDQKDNRSHSGSGQDASHLRGGISALGAVSQPIPAHGIRESLISNHH